MSRLGPPVVEALPDISWARVERNLWSALDEGTAAASASAPPATTRRWSRYALGAGVALAAAAALVFLWLWPDGRARSHDLPSRVATHEAPTTVSFGDAEITVASQSTMVLAGTPNRGVDIVLEKGSATFAVAPREGRPPFVVHAGVVDIRVVGTRFTVARSGDAARVDVAHGEVEVVAHGRRELVLAGGSWDSSRDWEAATRSSATDTNPDDVTAARTLSEPDAAVVDEPVDEPVVSTTPKPAPRVDPKAAYEAAASLEPSDPAAALAAYRKLARGSGPWAANALYAAARLADQEGQSDLARSLARQYAKRFPSGANAADAARLVTRLEGAP
ncbi:MAG TPA: FecR domain-containing protein [Kofleriaceae bacterium]|nr:FecR domain-containing protein [Kofleriaceae bacterium]